jgi:hypothetical protein
MAVYTTNMVSRPLVPHALAVSFVGGKDRRKCLLPYLCEPDLSDYEIEPFRIASPLEQLLDHVRLCLFPLKVHGRYLDSSAPDLLCVVSKQQVARLMQRAT